MNERIAVLTAGWNREFLNFMMQGICQRAAEDMADVYLFNCYGDHDEKSLFNKGEYNLFNLPELSKFSGLILFPNNISSAPVKESLQQRIQEAKIPSISVEYDLEGMDFVGIDNYTALSQIMEHLVVHHKFTKFFYVSGIDGHYESMERKRAFTDVLTKYDIPVSDDMLQNTNYSHDEAYQIASDWILEGKPLPEAFVCANDDLAIGICEAMSEFGYRVPEDIVVTGYDNFEAAINYSPRITTVDRAKKELGYESCNHLFQQIHGESVPRKVLMESHPIFSESCGCSDISARNNDAFRKQCFRKEAENRNLDGFLRLMSDELVNCDSFHSFKEKVQKYLANFHIHSFYLMVEHDEYDLSKAASLDYRTEGYSDTMVLACAIEGDARLPLCSLNTSDLFPGAFSETPQGNLYIFSPIHFQDRSIGYCVIKNSTYLLEHYFLYTWLNTLNSTIENIRQKRTLNAINDKLNALYMRDFLTDLYNRFGYEKKALPLYHKNCEEGKETFVIFFDMDRLKYINDCFGHNHGDLAIITLANTLKKYSPKDALAIRYGGDEFLIIGTFAGLDNLNELIGKITNELAEKTRLSNLPYDFSVSFGFEIAPSNSKMPLDIFVEKADANMYLDKQLKRKNRLERSTDILI